MAIVRVVFMVMVVVIVMIICNCSYRYRSYLPKANKKELFISHIQSWKLDAVVPLL